MNEQKIIEFLQNEHYPVARSKKEAFSLILRFIESLESSKVGIPSNQELEKEAKDYAVHHSEAPDKDCPDWIVDDWMAGALYVRTKYLGVINYEQKAEKNGNII
jgi:hypothetical protein